MSLYLDFFPPFKWAVSSLHDGDDATVSLSRIGETETSCDKSKVLQHHLAILPQCNKKCTAGQWVSPELYSNVIFFLFCLGAAKKFF